MDCQYIPIVESWKYMTQVSSNNWFAWIEPTFGHSQTARWFWTREHCAPVPHWPHDDVQRKSLHISCPPHSPSLSHSWRHPLNGLPVNPARHEHVGTPLITSHFVFWPQGLGWHCSSAKQKCIFVTKAFGFFGRATYLDRHGCNSWMGLLYILLDSYRQEHDFSPHSWHYYHMNSNKDWRSFRFDKPYHHGIPNGPSTRHDDSNSADYHCDRLDMSIRVDLQLFPGIMHLYHKGFENSLGLIEIGQSWILHFFILVLSSKINR